VGVEGAVSKLRAALANPKEGYHILKVCARVRVRMRMRMRVCLTG
jgi:hypothetical protein